MIARQSPEQLQAIVTGWIEDNIGPVHSVSRQGRWRPAWYVSAEKDGEPVELYVRGARGSRFPPMPLAYEAAVQQVFIDEGVKVSNIHGYIEEVPAIVMDRLPGRPNIATADSDEAREILRGQLADEMARIHAIDPTRIAALGAPNTDDAREATLLNYRIIDKLYLEGDRLPSPDIEFVRAWIERNAPPCEEGAAVITVDSGQFLFEGRELTGLVDFEHVCIGDRHVDLAALRTRDLAEEIGDLESFYDLYEERSGIRPDRKRIAFHWVTFALIVPLQVAHELAHPERGAEYYEYSTWHVQLMGIALRALAENLGIELKPYALPAPGPDRIAMMTEALVDVIGRLPASDEYETYRRFDMAITAQYLRDHAARSAAMEKEYLDEIEALTGHRPASNWDGDVHLTEFVKSAPPEMDQPILQLLFNRNQRVDLIQRMQHVHRREGKEME